MGNKIYTTGGAVSEEDIETIYTIICEAFHCGRSEIRGLKPMQKGLSNVVFSFDYHGGRYVFRYPGLGSEVLVDRGREAMVQSQALMAGVDKTLIAMSVTRGWRISRYIENRGFDYKNISDIVRAMKLLRRLHEVPVNVRWEFDVRATWEHIRDMTPEEHYGDNYADFADFSAIQKRVYALHNLSGQDGIRQCLTQGDCRDENFLINDEEIHLIDWEHGGYGDPGFDIGSYICGGVHSRQEVDRILFIYLEREPELSERRHFYAWIAITGFYYMHWTMFKEASGQKVGYLKPQWYGYAKEYSQLAIDMYERGEEG